MKSYKYFKYEPILAYTTSSCQEESLDNLTFSQQRVLDQIIQTHNKYLTCFINQSTIANRLGLSRAQVNRIIGQLCEMRLINKMYRHMRSCLYIPALILLDPQIRRKYRHKFFAFKYLSVIMLFANVFTSDVTQTTQDIRNIYLTVIDNQELHRDSNCKRTQRSPRRMYSTPERSQFILKLTKEFNLTKKGQLELAAYPMQALDYAHAKWLFSNQGKIDNPFSFFLSWCQVWCVENGIEADHGTKNQLLNQMKIGQWMPNVAQGQMEKKLTEEEKKSSDIKFQEQHTSFMKLHDKDEPMYGKTKGYHKRERVHPSKEWQGYDREQRFESMAEIRARKALRAGDMETYNRYTQEPDWTNPRVIERVHEMTKAFYHTPEEIERLRQELGRTNKAPRGLTEILANMNVVAKPQDPQVEQARPGRFNIRDYLAKHASPDIPRTSGYQHLKPEE